MSKLRTYQLQNPDSATVNIELDQSGGTTVSGILTASSGVVGNVTGTATTATNLADAANITTGTISNDRLPATITKNLTGNVTGNLTGNLESTASLAGISSSISDTAVDVFVYDTRKDSDGGAWRKRTQHTSWYNETLNTSTRGSRREFPAVAVIVSESDTLTIYDGDDPDLPMWMVFTTTGTVAANAIVRSSGYDISTVSMLNGLLVCGVNYNGGFEINFVSDDCHRRNPSVYAFGGNVASRNGGMSFITLNTTAVTVNTIVNDVAMTVLPNAPIDETTGLPIPTIAVATDGGLSIIRDDGTVVDIVTSDATYDDVNNIQFTEDNKIVYTEHSGDSYGWMYVHDIPSSDTTITLNTQSTALSYYDTRFPLGNFGQEGWIVCTRTTNGDRIDSLAVGGGLHLYVAPRGDSGLTFIQDNRTADKSSLIGYATTSYNTGWMHGDIKGAFLSDTDTTNVTGSELVSNYDFTSGTTNWTTSLNGGVGGASVTASSNQLVFTQGTNSVWLEAYQDITTVSGEKYVVDFEIASSNTTANWRIIVAGTTVIGYPTGLGQGHHSYTFTASGSTTRVSIQQGGAAGVSGTAESLSVRIAEEDRSVNNKGLQVYGTITKSAVATGADLVAYSEFSASNYLQQPYNSDLDFGTGDLSISFWYKMTSTASSQCLLHRGDGASGTWGSGNIIQIEMDQTYLEFQIAGPAFSPLSQVQVPIAQSATGQWQHFVGVRSGGVMSVYIDGVKYGNVASTQNATNTSARTWIGERPNISRPASNTSMSLFRMSASAPSPEQIKKIYEDEKVLFQENAACTLYGSSDAVTALAYDDSTNLLYAGTSSGRSDFQGLRRINNTTTAVTTAMSASNGLVAEQ